VKTSKVARSSPKEVAPSPQPEAPPRPLLPQRWNGKTVFNVAEVAEIFEMNPWVIYDLIRRKEMRSRSYWPPGQGPAARHRGNVASLNRAEPP
jgi:hypothetical protein